MAHGISRRTLLVGLSTAFTGFAGILLRAQAKPAKTPILVFKDPSCGCCSKWVDHMIANGFAPTVTEGDMGPVHARYKVPVALQSCHTASVANYVIEGHVPAADVRKLLAAKPANVIGLTIPGMPQSAPGMDVLPFRPYEVLSWDAKGATTVFAKHDKA